MRVSKVELPVLIRQNTRTNLSVLYQTKYQEIYPSFSIFVEALLLVGIENMDGR